VAASALLAVALVLTQLWFPYRYWELALEFDEPSSWLVLARDLVLLGVVAILAWPQPGSPRSVGAGGTFRFPQTPSTGSACGGTGPTGRKPAREPAGS
jgi:hypothetical protein